jgi:hypothetical protein
LSRHDTRRDHSRAVHLFQVHGSVGPNCHIGLPDISASCVRSNSCRATNISCRFRRFTIISPGASQSQLAPLNNGNGFTSSGPRWIAGCTDARASDRILDKIEYLCLYSLPQRMSLFVLMGACSAGPETKPQGGTGLSLSPATLMPAISVAISRTPNSTAVQRPVGFPHAPLPPYRFAGPETKSQGGTGLSRHLPNSELHSRPTA